jgi:ABC-2 type transport system ATP-binding protein
MLLGLVRPTSGRAELLGESAGDRSTRARVGFLPEHFRFYDWLTPAELLRFHGQLYGIDGQLLRRRIPALIDLVGLTPHQDKQIGKFSKGMLQRIGLAQALLNEPDVLFLDEPTSGLDPVGRRLVRDIIKLQRERGATIFLNSHLLSEVEVTCDRVAFIRRGEVIEVRKVSSFSEEGRTILIRAHGLTPGVVDGLSRWGTVADMQQNEIRIELNERGDAPEMLRYLVARGLDVFEFTPQKLLLEQRFLEILGGDEGL